VPADKSQAHFGRVRQNFSEKELVDLTLAILAINGWNRVARSITRISERQVPDETYE
jgi:alkylhydroperoxidase family enzyme